MPRKNNPELENNNKHWSVNEIAFLEFCRRKDLKYHEIAPLLDRSNASIQQMGSKVSAWQRNKLDPKAPQKKLIEKAMAMELSVRGGTYPDMRNAWYSKISKVTGIKYDFPESPLAKSEEELVLEAKKDSEKNDGGGVVEDDTFISIKIELGFNRAKELIKMIFGSKL